MEQYGLFLALKELLKSWEGQPFTLGFNDMDINADFDCGIYIRGDAPGEYRDMTTGAYVNRVARVQFLAQSDLSADGNIATAAFTAFIRNLLPLTIYETVSVTYKDVTYDVTIIKASLIGDVIPLGKNEQGRARYSLNALITYTISEKEDG